MTQMRWGVVDLSSVIWTRLLEGKDGEFGEWVEHNGKEKMINSAAYGFEGAIDHLLRFMDLCHLQPHQLILVKEGMNSKALRTSIHSAYKSNRDKVPAQYVQFNLCLEKVIEAMTSIGAQVVWQDGGVEADDVIGYLAQRLQGDVFIDSGDKDLAVNVGGRVHHHRNGVLDANPFGDFPHELIPVYIALVGDHQDKIPGGKDFGAKSWEKLWDAFGETGIRVMLDLIKTKQIPRLIENVAELPELRKLIDDPEGVYMSYELGRLMVERVNTLRRPLQWKVGMVGPRALVEDSRLRKFGGVVKLIHADVYEQAMSWARDEIAKSPFVALDVESSTPQESDDWIERLEKDEGKEPVDVIASKLTSLQITFGANLQFTVYLPIDNVEEADVRNLTVAQVRDFVDMIPRDKITWVHNASFELPVCYQAWGADWADDPLYHGFLRNVRDTAIASSYVDENRSKGLKGLSSNLLNYQQTEYKTVTTRDHRRHEWDGVGKVVVAYDEPAGFVASTDEAEGYELPGPPLPMVRVQRKMNQMRAREVLNYGADDTICTAALAVHFCAVMQIENTHHVFEKVETYPAYLTALAFVQGTPFDHGRMAELEAADDEAFTKAAVDLREYLMAIGFDGTVCPAMLDDKAALDYVMEKDIDVLPDHLLEFNPKGIKAAAEIILGVPFKTQVKKFDRLAHEIRKLDVPEENDEGGTLKESLALAIEGRDLDAINTMIAQRFAGEPVLDLNSPTQKAKLLYDRMGLPVRIINDVTPLQRKHDPKLAAAISKFKKIRNGASDLTMSDEDLAQIRKKAKADETAIDFALAYDTTRIDDSARKALRAIGVMMKVLTRRQLFYKNYWVLPHWTDGLIHASANQCAAVTRRYSMSNPNLQQLPKKGAGAKFRSCFKPHKRNAVVCSIDFVAQELRLAAWRSKDKNMLACYLGDKLKDIHSITAAGALKLKWGAEEVGELLKLHGADLTDDQDGIYDLFIRLRKLGIADPIGKRADDHRKSAKNVNFAAQNGAGAARISETEVMPFEDARMFLDAREDMFPDVRKAADRAAALAKKTGHAYTMMGAIRHLAKAMLSDESGAADRAARQAWNFEIQGSAGEMTKLAMANLWLSGIYFKFDARFIAPIHDELVDSVVESDAVEFIKLKHQCMTQPYGGMEIPVLGSISIGPNFHEQIECGDEFIEPAIRAALDKIFKKEAEHA